MTSPKFQPILGNWNDVCLAYETIRTVMQRQRYACRFVPQCTASLRTVVGCRARSLISATRKSIHERFALQVTSENEKTYRLIW